MTIIPAHSRQRQEDHNFKVILYYIASYLKKKKLGSTVGQTYNPGTWEAEAGESHVQSQYKLHSKS